MSWLLRDGEVLASCASVPGGLFGRVPVGVLMGAQLLPAQRLCLVGPDGADIALMDHEHVVRSLGSHGPWRPVFSQGQGMTMMVAERGAFSRWRLRVGDRLEIR